MDDKGQPVECTSIMVGKNLLYTSRRLYDACPQERAADYWSTPREFMSGFTYEVGSAPAISIAGSVAQIIVRRV